MKRLLPILLLVFSVGVITFADRVWAYNFMYSDVYACGPKVVKSIPNRKNLDDPSYYLIHFEKERVHFSIFSNKLEYSTFKKITSTNLYVQRGGTRWLVLDEEIDGIYRFNLFTKNEYGLFKEQLMFDKNSKTSISKDVWRTDKPPRMGVCWDYRKGLEHN